MDVSHSQALMSTLVSPLFRMRPLRPVVGLRVVLCHDGAQTTPSSQEPLGREICRPPFEMTPNTATVQGVDTEKVRHVYPVP